ncbi:MAG: hypothetical protein J3K34DRAFT_428013 [Monoraphidium minutum]|nr:MAG: hypothetical protein J3K34DRAFT_428013 [Monoraphidium minutum]
MYRDRSDAGARLGDELAARGAALGGGGGAPLVLALPRGGVPVGDAVARRLRAPLEVLVVRKIGAPIHPEYAIGAIAEGGAVRLDADAAAMVGAGPAEVEAVMLRERAELERRRGRGRGPRGPWAAESPSGRSMRAMLCCTQSARTLGVWQPLPLQQSPEPSRHRPGRRRTRLASRLHASDVNRRKPPSPQGPGVPRQPAPAADRRRRPRHGPHRGGRLPRRARRRRGPRPARRASGRRLDRHAAARRGRGGRGGVPLAAAGVPRRWPVLQRLQPDL